MKKSLSVILNQHRAFSIPFLIFIAASFAIEALISKADLFLLINSYHSDFFDVFFEIMTYLGDGIAVILVGVILCLFNYRQGIITLLAYAYTSAVAQIIKFAVHTPRPVKFFEGVHAIRTIDGYTIHQWNSFPSGHSASIFSLGVIIVYLLPAKYQKMAFIILPIALLTAFSRVYLAQHFFQDVVAGSIIGTVFTFHLIYLLENSRWYHSGKLNSGLFKR